MAMAGTHKSDSKTDAQRAFEELLRKAEAHLKKASLESEGGNRTEFSRGNGEGRTTKLCSFELAPD